jgi:hypothetical protein
MKKLLIVLCLSFPSFCNSSGQWYVKRYNVTDIKLLSIQQLDESLEKSKKQLIFSGCVAGFGGLLVISSLYLHPGMSDDPSTFEQLLGDKGMDDIYLCVGAGILACGIISSLNLLGRISKIKLTMIHNYQSTVSLNISPAAILNYQTKSFCPGFRLTCNF